MFVTKTTRPLIGKWNWSDEEGWSWVEKRVTIKKDVWVDDDIKPNLTLFWFGYGVLTIVMMLSFLLNTLTNFIFK